MRRETEAAASASPKKSHDGQADGETYRRGWLSPLSGIPASEENETMARRGLAYYVKSINAAGRQELR
jgi:hypothetical protein